VPHFRTPTWQIVETCVDNATVSILTNFLPLATQAGSGGMNCLPRKGAVVRPLKFTREIDRNSAPAAVREIVLLALTDRLLLMCVPIVFLVVFEIELVVGMVYVLLQEELCTCTVSLPHTATIGKGSFVHGHRIVGLWYGLCLVGPRVRFHRDHSL
jgi:hypothetical protein